MNEQNQYSRGGALLWLVVLVAAVLAGALLPLHSAQSEADTTAAAVPETTESTEQTQALATEAVPTFADAYLILVNRDNSLPETYSVELTQLHDWELSVAECLYEDLREMLAAGRAEGLSFQICSAYRTKEEQQELFDEDVRALLARGYSQEAAEAAVHEYTMLPGQSEHETGLALDIVAASNQNLDETQADTAESKWLHSHCAEYGFILRYPEGKSDITGIAGESWHYRYVGHEAAAYLTENGLTLEEYWQKLAP